MTPCQCRHEGDTAARGLRRSFRGWHGIEFAILRMATSHGLIAYGDLSGDDFVYWRHEFAILRMATSHGFEP
jgi:hypothetical protein